MMHCLATATYTLRCPSLLNTPTVKRHRILSILCGMIDAK
jgi:hypothetical protein